MHFGKYTIEDKIMPRERDYMTTRLVDIAYSSKKHIKVSELIRENHFWSVWKSGDKSDLFEITKLIIAQLNTWICEQEGVPSVIWKRGENEAWHGHTDKIVQPMDWEEFDFRFQHTNPFHPEYMQARHEYWRLLMGDF